MTRRRTRSPGSFFEMTQRSYFFFAVRLRVVRRTARFAGAFFAAFLVALRRFLAGAFFAALRLAGAFFAALRLTVFFAALRLAGAFFFAALRLAGAFFAALRLTVFLAG